jgi:hypothetical protein
MKKLAVALTAVTLIFSLSSCTQVAEQVAENAIGGDVEINEDGVTVTDENGNSISGGSNAKLPASWPAEVPAFDGTLISSAAQSSDNSHVAIWTSQEAAATTFENYKTALQDAGFSTVIFEGNASEVYTYSATGNGYEVSLQVGAAGGDTSVTLLVKKI